MNPRQQMSIECADKKDLERSQAAAAEARRAMQVALQTWARNDEMEKSREDYDAQVKQRLKVMEKAIESSIPGIIREVKQEVAPHIQKVSYHT